MNETEVVQNLPVEGTEIVGTFQTADGLPVQTHQSTQDLELSYFMRYHVNHILSDQIRYFICRQ